MPAVASLCATATRAHDGAHDGAFPLYVRRTDVWGLGGAGGGGGWSRATWGPGQCSADAWPCSAQDPLPETGVTFQTSDAALQGLYDHGDTQ